MCVSEARCAFVEAETKVDCREQEAARRPGKSRQGHEKYIDVNSYDNININNIIVINLKYLNGLFQYIPKGLASQPRLSYLSLYDGLEKKVVYVPG